MASKDIFGRSERAFTLIELLIVVAIIAILAAIAVPNFLEAQVRSKVSRARADMRTIATGLEAYAVDYNHYPSNPDPLLEFYVTPNALTTPVAYLSIKPIDPFKDRVIIPDVDDFSMARRRYYDYYTILSTGEYFGYVMQTGISVFIVAVDGSGVLEGLANQDAFSKYGKWLQWSIGPDIRLWILEDDFSAGLGMLVDPAHLPWGYSFDVPYDATNGTKSFGNIIRSQKNPEGTYPVG